MTAALTREQEAEIQALIEKQHERAYAAVARLERPEEFSPRVPPRWWSSALGLFE